MKINNNREYNKIPDGSICRVLYTGSSWGEECGKEIKVIKKDFKLCINDTDYLYFYERCEEINYIHDFSFEVYYYKEDN